MKKKLFLVVLMVAIMVCAFAISASAATPDTEGETVTLTDGTVLPLWDTDGDALIWYVATDNTEDGYAAYDYIKATDSAVDYNRTWSGNIITKKAYQIGTIKITVGSSSYTSQNHIVVANLMDDVKVTSGSADIGQPVNCFSGTFNSSKVLEYAFLPLDTVSLQATVFTNCKALKYVNLESLTILERIFSQTMSGCTSLFQDNTVLDLSNCAGLIDIMSNCLNGTKITKLILPNNAIKFASSALEGLGELVEFTIPSNTASFSTHVFRSCKKLERVYGFEVLIEKGVLTTIPTYTFGDCLKLTSITNIPAGVTAIGDWAFYNCQSLTELTLPEGITSIGEGSFKNCYALYAGATFKIPNSVTTIAGQAFQNMTAETIKLSANLQTIGSNAFRDCNKVKYIYMPATITSIAAEALRGTSGSLVIFYTGTDVQNLVDATVDNQNYIITDANVTRITLEEYNALTTKSGRYIVYGYNNCDAFYNGVHEEKLGEGETDTNLCILTKCAHCDYANVYVGNETTHIFTYTYAYANGYNKQGTTTCACANAGCQKSAENEPEVLTNLAPIFTFLGYSTNDVNTEFAIGFSVDKTALAFFEENANVTFEYGVIAAAGNNDPMNAVGIPTIKANVPETVSSFNLRIRGFNTDEDRATSISMGMFVKTTDEGANTTSAYIQKEQSAALTAYTLAQYIIDNTVA